MAIKWKGWTSRLAVKWVCFLGVLLCGFTQLYLSYDILQKRWDGALYDVGLTSWMTEERYAREQLYSAYHNAAMVARYRSEERIKSGVLINIHYEDGNWLPLSESGLLPGAGLPDEDEPAGNSRVVMAEDYGIQGFYSAVTGEQLAYHYSSGRSAYGDAVMAVQEQLREYQDALASLEKGDVAYWIVTAEGTRLGNFPDEKLPYRLEFEGGAINSNVEDFYWGDVAYDWVLDPLEDWPHIVLATDAGGYAGMLERAAQGRVLMQNFLIASGCVSGLGLVLLVVLTLGTGRRYGEGKERVFFTPLDTVYLDLLVLLLGAGCVCLGNMAIWVLEWFDISRVWRGEAVITVLTLLGLLPALLCYQCLVRRWKAGGWWRHTLTWRILRNILWPFRAARRALREGGKRFRQSWSQMTYRTRCVLAIGLVWFCILLCLVLPPLILAALFASALLIWNHYRSLGNLERMARAVESGEYQPRQEQVGEFVRVARSLGQISRGLDDAVRKRMQSERLKTELITNVSHDLRTPLTSMITYADLLKTEGLTSDRAPEYLEVLIGKTQRLKTLTDELFEAAKAASGSVEVHLEPLDFTQLINQCMGELDERIAASGLDFRLTLPEEAQVRADGRMLQRIMENLLTNVLKYALPGSRVYLDLSPEEVMWRMELKNISAQPLNVAPEELTERFKRGDDARQGEGSGLGLSIVQSFVEAQGGSLRIVVDGDLFKAVIRLPQI